MPLKISRVALLLGIAGALGADDVRDVVKLKSGSELKGRVVYEDDETVVLRVGSRDQTIPAKSVASVESVARSLEEYLERLRQTANDDVAAHLDLAAFCLSRRLEREGRLEALQVLRSDPKNEKAHEILKHRRSGDSWFVSLDGGEVAWSLVDKTTSDFGKAFRLDTEHYSIRTNAGVGAAVDLARDLEYEYSAFYQVFGEDLKLREILEPMTVNAYRTRKDWPPSAASHAGGYFDSAGRIAYIYYETFPGRPPGLFHEGIHALLFMAIERAQGGSVPAWVDEGLAMYFESALTGPPGLPTLELGRIDASLFRECASAVKPDGLTRVLNYNASDFQASTNQRYKYAAVYTLVHFLIHADGEAHRQKFAAFLREASRSKASSSRFEKALGSDERVIEKAWRKYVAEKARPAK